MCLCRKTKQLIAPSVSNGSSCSSIDESTQRKLNSVPIPSHFPIGNEKLNTRTHVDNPEEEKKRIMEVMKACGESPNTAVVDKMLRVSEQEDKGSSGSLEKVGDILFDFDGGRINLKSSSASKDDTQFELKSPTNSKEQKNKNKKIYRYGQKERPSKEEEDLDFATPNEKNFMYNRREMYYVVHDMIRFANKENLPNANVHTDLPFNPYGDLEFLRAQELFNCKTLRRNSFLSNVGTMPLPGEQNISDKTKERTSATGSRASVYHTPSALDLTLCPGEEDTAMEHTCRSDERTAHSHSERGARTARSHKSANRNAAAHAKVSRKELSKKETSCVKTVRWF